MRPSVYGDAILYYTGPAAFAEQMAAMATEKETILFPWAKDGEQPMHEQGDGQAVVTEEYEYG